jgi:ABC-type branched-subunit amino acid transport system substrate-binding protein
VLDQTGPLANESWKDSALLAVEQANAGLKLAGGFHDALFGMVVADSISDPEVTLLRGQKLIADGAVAIITDTGEDALALTATQYDASSKNDLGVPVICTGCTSPKLGDPFASHFDEVRQKSYRDRELWGYRTSADSIPEAKALLTAIESRGSKGDINHDGRWKIALYVIDDDFGNGFVEGFKAARDELFPWVDIKNVLSCERGAISAFCNTGLRIEVIRHPPGVDANSYNWSDDLTLLLDEFNDAPTDNPGQPISKDGEPDYIVEATFPLFAAGFTRAHVDANEATPLFHTHNWRHFQTLVKLLNTDVDGHAGVSHAVLDNCDEAGRPFASALFAKTGRGPGLWDAQHYDATMVTMLASLVAISDMSTPNASKLKGVQVRDALSRVSDKSAEAVKVTGGAEGFADAVKAIRKGLPIDYVGASGPVDFDENGNVKNDFVSFEVVRGLFVDRITHDCTGDVDCSPKKGACTWQ